MKINNIDMVGLGSIGAVKTDGQVGGKEHGAKKILFSPARVAFLGLIRINLWGIASTLAQTAFLVDAATTAKQSPPNMWWDIGAMWRNGWYNLGGTWSSFEKAVKAGKNKKPFLVAIAPRSIKNKLKSKGITGVQGIGSAATITAITTAAGIIAAMTPLLLGTMNLLKKKSPETTDTLYVDEFGNPVLDPKYNTGSGQDDGLMTAGYGLLGAGILAALYFGTKKSKK